MTSGIQDTTILDERTSEGAELRERRHDLRKQRRAASKDTQVLYLDQETMLRYIFWLWPRRTFTWRGQRREVSAEAKIVYARLALHAKKEGVAFPKLATLAAECGMSVDTVMRCLKELEDTGLIVSFFPGRGKSMRYRFLDHAWAKEWREADMSNKKAKAGNGRTHEPDSLLNDTQLDGAQEPPNQSQDQVEDPILESGGSSRSWNRVHGPDPKKASTEPSQRKLAAESAEGSVRTPEGEVDRPAAARRNLEGDDGDPTGAWDLGAKQGISTQHEVIGAEEERTIDDGERSNPLRGLTGHDLMEFALTLAAEQAESDESNEEYGWTDASDDDDVYRGPPSGSAEGVEFIARFIEEFTAKTAHIGKMPDKHRHELVRELEECLDARRQELPGEVVHALLDSHSIRPILHPARWFVTVATQHRVDGTHPRSRSSQQGRRFQRPETEWVGRPPSKDVRELGWGHFLQPDDVDVDGSGWISRAIADRVAQPHQGVRMMPTNDIRARGWNADAWLQPDDIDIAP